MNESVARLANRAAIDPHFLAFSLTEFAIAEKLDEAGLAVVLGTTADMLPHIRLCRVPRTDADGFREDVDRIAEKFGLNRDALAAVARHGQVVAAMRAADAADPTEAGFLLAARDRPKP
jgi:hypothetical protein